MSLIKCCECGREISNKARNCPNCGCPVNSINISEEQENKDLEGTEVGSENSNSTNFKIVMRTSDKVILCIIISIVVFVIGCVIYQNRPLTDSEKQEVIWDIYFSQGYDAALSKISEYYGTTDKAVAMLMLMDDNDEEDIIDKIGIKQDMNKDGNYYDYTVTFENNSESTITYIKYTVYLKDENNKIIHSDWSNWSGTLSPNAKVQTDTMIEYIEGASSYSIIIDEIRTK